VCNASGFFIELYVAGLGFLIRLDGSVAFETDASHSVLLALRHLFVSK